MIEGLFDKTTIKAALTAVATRLKSQDAQTHVLVIVGGSFMALSDLRNSTQDVDTLTRLTATLRKAVSDVAIEYGYEPDWLNDHAAAYLPQGLREQDCTLLAEYPSLRVLGPPPNFVFIMKLYAARGEVDHSDMVRLWPICNFTSVADAIDLYWSAYPHAPDDEHLATYVDQIAREATTSM